MSSSHNRDPGNSLAASNTRFLDEFDAFGSKDSESRSAVVTHDGCKARRCIAIPAIRARNPEFGVITVSEESSSKPPISPATPSRIRSAAQPSGQRIFFSSVVLTAVPVGRCRGRVLAVR